MHKSRSNRKKNAKLAQERQKIIQDRAAQKRKTEEQNEALGVRPKERYPVPPVYWDGVSKQKPDQPACYTFYYNPVQRYARV